MITIPNWQVIESLEKKMREEEGASVLRLFEISGLDPDRHFRGNDWRYVPFDGLDLRGYDFRNCRLFGASWAGSRVSGAKFEDSDVEITRLDKAVDWREASLTDAQRDVLEVKSLLSGNPTPDAIRNFSNKKAISEGQWVTLIKSAPSFEAAHSYYQLMAEHGFGDSKYALTTLLDQAKTSAQVAISKNLLSQKRVSVDSHLVATLISKVQSENEAREIFEREKNNIERTIFVYNALLSKIDYVEKAEDIFNMMREDGVKIDHIGLNPFIWKAATFAGAKWLYDKISSPRTADLNAVLSHVKWSDGDISKKLGLEMLRDGPKPDARTFNVIISACTNYSDALSVLKLMQQYGHQPDIYTACSLLTLIPRESVEAIDRCFHLLTKLLEGGAKSAVESQEVVTRVMQLIGAQPEEAVAEHADGGKAVYKRRNLLIELATKYASASIASEFKKRI